MPFDKLVTDRLIVRKFTSHDVPAIFRLSQEKSLGDWIPDQVYEDEAESARVIGFLQAQYELSPEPKKRPFVLCIALKENGEVIGHVGLSSIDDGEVEVGYAIEEDYQRKGYATEAVSAVCHWALNNLDLQKIKGIVAKKNIGSGRVLEKAGFELKNEKDRSYLGVIQTCRMFEIER